MAKDVLIWIFLLICFVTTAAATTDCEEEEASTPPLWISLPSVAVLIALSGLFSGLTLGLLGLDIKQLEIVASGDSDDKRYAEIIIPVREKGNFLLCTLLLGNVAVNAALAILLAQLAGGTAGFLVSTALIVIFGEIIPQATCSRYALYIGAHTVWLVVILMWVMSPIAWPISKVLDWALGEEFGNMYTNMELKKLIQLHKDNEHVQLDVNTAKVLEGALNFYDQTVGNVMTDWDKVYKLNIDERLDFALLTDIFKNGHSRIPVVQTKLGIEEVAGLLIVKDLVLLDPEDEIPVATIVQLFEHVVLPVYMDDQLSSVLDQFQQKFSHLAIVRDILQSENRDPTYQIKGIVTLEDIIEVILQENIVDETDVFVSSRSQAKTSRKFDENMLSFFDYHKRNKNAMFHTEATAVYHYLVKSIPILDSQNLVGRDQSFRNLLSTSPIIDIKVTDRDPEKGVDDNGLILYEHEKRTEYFYLVLEGKVEVFAGRQKFHSEHARWSYFCPQVLDEAHIAWQNNTPYIAVVPDFTCRVIKDSRLLRVSSRQFMACLEGKYDDVELRSMDSMSRPKTAPHALEILSRTGDEDSLRSEQIYIDKQSVL